MTIKRISLSDVSYVVDLFVRYRIFYDQAPDIERSELFLTERLQNNESVIFVALNPTKKKLQPVGFTQLYPKYSSARLTKNWILNDLYVDTDYRKQGTATNLIKAAIQFAKENGATFVQLETAYNNFTAQKLYEKLGFTKQETDTEWLMYRIPL